MGEFHSQVLEEIVWRKSCGEVTFFFLSFFLRCSIFLQANFNFKTSVIIFFLNQVGLYGEGRQRNEPKGCEVGSLPLHRLLVGTVPEGITDGWQQKLPHHLCDKYGSERIRVQLIKTLFYVSFIFSSPILNASTSFVYSFYTFVSSNISLSLRSNNLSVEEKVELITEDAYSPSPVK